MPERNKDHTPHLGKERKFSFQHTLLTPRSLAFYDVKTVQVETQNLKGQPVVKTRQVVSLTPEQRQMLPTPPTRKE